MSKIKYQYNYFHGLTKIEVVSETTHFMTVVRGGVEMREKKSNYTTFDTFDEAKEHVIKKLNVSIENKKIALDSAQIDLRKMFILTEQDVRKV